MGNQKSGPSATTGQQPPALQEAATSPDPDRKYVAPEKIPIEEQSLHELYPELDVTNLMQLDRIACKHEHSHLHQDYIKNPLPALTAALSKPVPVPSYSEVQATKPASLKSSSSPSSKFILPKFSRYVEATEDELAERVEYDMDEQGFFLLIFPLSD